MNLASIAKRPLQSRQYLERYVNDGSPSGFSEVNRTSPNTDPFGLTPWFHLYLVTGPNDWFLRRGQIPNWIDSEVGEKQGWILIHPDMVSNPVLSNPELTVGLFDKMRVVPTSSARTVQISSLRSPDYIKLHYEGVLGRINRSLPFRKTVAGLEASAMIEEGVERRKLNDRFWVFPEVGSVVAFFPLQQSAAEWGMIWRSWVPLGTSDKAIAHVWPVFSLFSVDRLAPYEPPLLRQIIERSGTDPTEFLLTELVRPIVRSYVQLISVLGLQPEWNAQNLLVALDNNFRVLGVVMRDLADLEKDLTIRKFLMLPCDFESVPYKCISIEDGELYKIRHSFAFDFKLGEYVLEPLAHTVSEEYDLNVTNLRASIKELARELLLELPCDFFPEDGLCYKHERITLTGDRPYVTAGKPKFR